MENPLRSLQENEMVGSHGDIKSETGRQLQIHFVYGILATVAIGAALGRIAAVDSVDRRALEDYRFRQIPVELERQRQRLEARGVSGEALREALAEAERRLYQQALLCRPFLSANDRSRWAAVRALVEPDMRVPGAPYAIDRVIQDPLWDTIDMVKHDGHLYSSKPPFLSTLMALPYWVLYRLTGWSLGEHPYLVGRILLVVGNVLPLALYFWLVARMVERCGADLQSRGFVFTAACFGTFLTTFAVTFNNHLPAAIAAAAALYLAIRIILDQMYTWQHYALCGLAAGFAAACEMPALAFLAAVAVLTLLPPSLQGSSVNTGQGGQAEQGAGDCRLPAGACLFPSFRRRLKLFVLGFLPPVLGVACFYFGTNWIAHRTLLPPYLYRSQTDPARNWYIFTYERQGRVIQSYWTNPVGIDRGEPNPWVYAFHVLVGHHGIFSLTPIWFLAVVGTVRWMVRPPNASMRWIVLMTALVSLACIAFYLLRPQMDRNYGGVASGFRWTFWLTPLWLLVMLPAVQWLAKTRLGWIVCLLALAISVLSTHYPTWNPWVHPWLYEWMWQQGWIQ
jgi:hypothetical protein